MPRLRPRAASATAAVTASLVALPGARAGAQQYITDDAAVTEDRACQIQTWAGQRASWVLPVCTPVRNVELSLGFIAVWRDGAGGHFESVAQAKTVLVPVRPGRWGVGLTAGRGRDPGLAGVDRRTTSYYAYVPVTRALFGERVLVHQNTGWLLTRRAGSDLHAVTWAGRADVTLRKYLVAVAEVYGAEGVGAGGAAGDQPAEFQVGLRGWLRPDRVQLDGSYGGTLRTGRNGAGFTLGLTLVTPPFL